MSRIRLKSFIQVLTLFTFCNLILSACGHTSSENLNPPFINKLEVNKVTPSAKFDVSPASNEFSKLVVYDENGNTVTLDADKQPILFEAYWCPHCQRTLVLLNKNRSVLHEMPILVSMGFKKGTNLKDAVHLNHQEMSQLNLKNEKVYYLLDDKNNLINTYPVLVFPRDNQLFMLSGEHTLAVWEKAINNG